MRVVWAAAHRVGVIPAIGLHDVVSSAREEGKHSSTVHGLRQGGQLAEARPHQRQVGHNDSYRGYRAAGPDESRVSRAGMTGLVDPCGRTAAPKLEEEGKRAIECTLGRRLVPSASRVERVVGLALATR